MYRSSVLIDIYNYFYLNLNQIISDTKK